MRASELIGGPLDYWVARARGIKPENVRIAVLIPGSGAVPCCQVLTGFEDDPGSFAFRPSRPSTNWDHAGPIIARERITFQLRRSGYDAILPAIDASCPGEGHTWPMYGETHLIAAMRAYVASKYGEEVPDLPA
jgi:hypothetical protein